MWLRLRGLDGVVETEAEDVEVVEVNMIRCD
jgi:hypothetical protein